MTRWRMRLEQELSCKSRASLETIKWRWSYAKNACGWDYVTCRDEWFSFQMLLQLLIKKWLQKEKDAA